MPEWLSHSAPQQKENMKLRIKGNSLRLRLTKGEVEEFGKKGKVTDSIEFGSSEHNKLTYSLISSDESNRVTTEFDNGKITVFVPASVAQSWTGFEQVGFDAIQRLVGEESLSILVEKDFVCLTEREGEDESDNYPHPKAQHA